MSENDLAKVKNVGKCFGIKMHGELKKIDILVR